MNNQHKRAEQQNADPGEEVALDLRQAKRFPPRVTLLSSCLAIVAMFLLLVAFTGCESTEDTVPETKVAVSDVREVLGVFIGEDHQIEAWRSNNKPRFVFVEGIHSKSMFTDQEFKDFVDRANEKVDLWADQLIISEDDWLTVLADENNDAEEQKNAETTWFVVKYCIRGRSPSVFVRVSKGNVGIAGPLNLQKNEADDSERAPGLFDQFSGFKYRVAYPQSDRIL